MPAHHKPNLITVDGEVASMILTRRDGTEVVTIFDAEDVPKVQAHPFRWNVFYEKRTDSFYVKSVRKENGQYKLVRLHRFLTDCPPHLVPDHRNHDTLDNRKSNLLLVPQRVNLQNKNGAYKSSRSGVRGVYWHKAVGKWCADVCLMGKRHCRFFEDFDKACAYVQEARKKHFKQEAI